MTATVILGHPARRVGRFLLAVVFGLGIAALSFVASLLWRTTTASATPATCSLSGTVATITLQGGPTTVSQAAGALTVGGTPCGALATLTSIVLQDAGGAAPQTVIFDQTAGVFPCAAKISGTLGGDTVQVNGASGETIIAGSTGIDLGSCGAGGIGTLTGVSTYLLDGGGGILTLSAAGDGGADAPLTGAATLTAASGSTTTLQPGNGAETLSTAAAATSLDFSRVACTNAPCALTVNLSGATLPSGLVNDAGTLVSKSTATLGTYTLTPPGTAAYTTFLGTSTGTSNFYAVPGTYHLGGNATLDASTGTYTVVSAGTGNQVAAGTGTETFAASGSPLKLTGGADSDTFTDNGNGNTFVAGSGTDVFYSAGTANTVDFSKVGTSAGAPLAIDVAGAPETVGTTLLKNGQAAVGSTVSYTFLAGPGSTDASGFTAFVGATTGNTEFLAGGAGGLSFTGNGNGNSAVFLGPTGVVVDLSGNPQTIASTQLSPNPADSVTKFSLADGQVVVAPPGSLQSCGTTPIATFCDSLINVTTVTGPGIGYSTFYAGSKPSYTFSDQGDHNRFIGGSGTDLFSSGGNFNTFVAGSGPATFSESESSQGASNTIDFSAVPVAPACPGCSLTVNVSGSPTAVQNYQAAVLSGAQPQTLYNFGSGGPDFTTFIGTSGGHTTFDGGLGGYTYTGQGFGNTLDFSAVAPAVASSLTFDVTHSPLPLATLAQVPETFSGVTTLVGLSGGGTQFQGGNTGGYTFEGNGSGNQATFTTQGPSTTLTVTITSSGTVSGGTVNFAIAGGATLCTGVPVVSSGGSQTASCYTSSLLPASTEVVATYIPPAGSSLSASTGVVIAPSGAPAGPPATTTILNISPNPVQGAPATLSATVTSGAPLPAGSVAFTSSDGTVLCTVNAGAGTSVYTCPSFAFPEPGHFDVIAVYTPSGGSVAGSAASALVNVTPEVTTTTTTTYNISFVFGGNCPASIFFNCDASATVTTGTTTPLAAGTVTFTLAGSGSVLCQAPVAGGSPSATVSCAGLALDTQQLYATYVPNPAASNPVGASAGTTTAADPFFNSPNADTTLSLGSSPASPIQGTNVNLTATVTTGAAGGLPGGTVTFSVVGGITLCTVVVQTGVATAIVQCSAPFSGNADVLAVYTPPSSANFYGSAAQTPIAVVLTTATTTSTGSTQDAKPGVVVNLSGSPAVSPSTSGVPGVTVGGSQVLVAAPSAGITSCSGALLSTFCDSLVDISVVNGSAQGNNTFVAGNGSETFGDTGNAGGDAINFSNVATSTQNPLTVNVSGAPAGISNYTATAGAATYTFSTGGSDFTTFTGSLPGNTTYLAGPNPGYTFTATGTNNSIDFSAVANGVNVNLSAFPAGTVNLATSGTCPGPTCDSINGLATVTGAAGGGNTFTAGGTAASYNFTGNGNNNLFVGGAGVDTFTSNGSNNIFRPGTGNATFNDAGSNNTVDFQALTGAVSVDVSGVQVGATANDTATAGGATYNFTSFGNAPTTFQGSPGGTAFYAGTAPDTFDGHGGSTTPDTLSFAFTPSGGPLFVCLVTGNGCSAPDQAVLGSVKEPFSGINTFVSLATGNTTFVAGSAGGYNFTATGANNSADFSAATAGIIANLVTGSVQLSASTCTASPTTCDSITNVTSVLGSKSAGHNTFVAGNGSETFGDTGGAGGDGINFAGVPTSSSTPLTINVSGTPANGVASNTASAGSSTYTFTNGGANFVTFTGPASGNARFVASGGAGGYTFSGAGPNNTADFSAVLNGITANLSPTPEGGVAQGRVELVSAGVLDTLAGVATLIGSPTGTNTFYGDLTGTNFTSNSGSNVVSYEGLTSTGVIVNLLTDQIKPQTGGPGTPDTFSFAPGTLAIQGSPGSDTFTIGTAIVTIQGGGGHDTIDLSSIPAPFSGTTGVTVNLAAGSISGPTIGGVTFTAGCADATSLCVTSVTGSRYDDTFIANAGSLAAGFSQVAISGNGGNDTLDLSQVTTAAMVEMTGAKDSTAVCSIAGRGCVIGGGTTGIVFNGIANVTGTAAGGDSVVVGSGNANFTESVPGSGTLDFSKLPVNIGVSVTVGQVSGVDTGTATSGTTVSDTFSGFTTFIGTANADTFKQTTSGAYNFQGGGGANTLDLSASPADISVTLSAPDASCTSGAAVNDGKTYENGLVQDTFTCMATIISAGTRIFTVSPGQTGTINGGGNGKLVLTGDTTGNGVTITLPIGNGLGTVSGDGYSFSFTGISMVNGTPFNDLFIAGTSNVTINGGGGNDGISFYGAPAAEVVNLSGNGYTIPAGLPGAGTLVLAGTATGGYGGTITMTGISNVIATSQYNDILVAGSGSGSLIGGAGNDRFVLTGGNDYIDGGIGRSTLDLSLLSGQTSVDLNSSALQSTGAGSVEIVAGTISTLIASPAGSSLSAGDGNNITLVGGAGNDWLAAGAGTQTLIGNGGNDILVAGSGTDLLQGGAQPVTFIPGSGIDTLIGQALGNTLSYATSPNGAQVNLSTGLYTVPPTQPFAGLTLNGQTARGGWGGTVSLLQANVANVIGSAQADLLVTGAGSDNFNGGGGADLFVALTGNNTLTAEPGSLARFLFAGAGSNSVNGGGLGTVDFSPAGAGVTVNLQSGTASGGFGGTQHLTGILNVVGTNLNDVLVAGAPGGTIVGLNGNDFLETGPLGGDGLVGLGSGNDTFCAQANCAVAGSVAEGSPGAMGSTIIGGSGDDTFFVRNGVIDALDGGAGTNEAQIDFLPGGVPEDRLTNIGILLP